jgi:hypothetical protein
MPVFDMSAHNFLANPAIDVFTFGRPPVAIDILVAIDIITQLKGLDFKEAFEAAAAVEVDNLPVRLIQYQHLLQAKKAAGRPRDQNDIGNLLAKKESSH